MLEITDARRKAIEYLRQYNFALRHSMTLSERKALIEYRLASGISAIWSDGDRVQSNRPSSASFVSGVEECDELGRAIDELDRKIKWLDAALNELSETKRAVLKDYYCNGLTDLRISMERYMSETTVRRIRHAALDEFTRALFDYSGQIVAD